MNNKGLGRGIQALFDGNGDKGGKETAEAPSPLVMLPLDSIMPNPAQPREVFAEEPLEELAASIARHGVLQPLLVRPAEDGSYLLVAGERRLRAARKAGLTEAPALVRPLDDKEARIVTLLENLQRQDLNPIEEAKGLEALREATGATLDELAETLGRGRSSIAHAFRLLKFDPVIQNDIAEGAISPSHAKAMASLKDDSALMELRGKILDMGLTTRDTEEAVAFYNENGRFNWKDNVPGLLAGSRKRPGARISDPGIVALAKNIGAALNCKTRISGTQEKGRISISYDSNEQLFDLLAKMGLTLAEQGK